MKTSTTKTSGWLTIGALGGMAIAHMATTLAVEGELPGFAVVFELMMVGVAALAATRRWWAYTLSAAFAALIFLMTFTGVMDRLAELPAPGILGVVAFLGLALVASVAGIGSAVQARRARRGLG